MPSWSDELSPKQFTEPSPMPGQVGDDRGDAVIHERAVTELTISAVAPAEEPPVTAQRAEWTIPREICVASVSPSTAVAVRRSRTVSSPICLF